MGLAFISPSGISGRVFCNGDDLSRVETSPNTLEVCVSPNELALENLGAVGKTPRIERVRG